MTARGEGRGAPPIPYALLGHLTSGLPVAAVSLCGLAASRPFARVFPAFPGAAITAQLDPTACLVAACALALSYMLYLVWIVAWLAWGCDAFLGDRRR